MVSIGVANMASPGMLIDTIAEMFLMPKNAVAYPWRCLREVGAVSVSGRGRSAAWVTPGDAANLLIAVVADLPGKDCVSAWQAYARGKSFHGTMPDGGHNKGGAWNFDWLGEDAPDLSFLTALPPNHAFSDVLSALISASSEGKLAPFVETPGAGLGIVFEADLPPSSTVGLRWSAQYVSRTYADMDADPWEIQRSLLRTEKSFGLEAISKLGTLINTRANSPQTNILRGAHRDP
jgi:hypothetical protein